LIKKDLKLINDNIFNVRKKIGLSQKDFANSLSITNTSLSYYESGKRTPDANFLQSLVVVYNVNLNWLVTGKGEMFINHGGDGDIVNTHGVGSVDKVSGSIGIKNLNISSNSNSNNNLEFEKEYRLLEEYSFLCR